MPDAPAAEDRYRSRRQRALERQLRRRARAVVFLTVFGAAALAIWGLPKRSPPLPRDTTAGRGETAIPVSRRDTIRARDGVVTVLVRAGLPRDDALAVLKASEMRGTARRDIPLAIYADSAAAPVREVEFQVADDRSIRVMRTAGNTWSATERRELWRTDTVVIRTATRGSLVESMRNAGRGALTVRGRIEAAYALAEAFEYKLDVGRDLAPGDSALVVMERRRTAFGAEQVGALVAGGIYHDGQWLRAIRFSTNAGNAEYYDLEGRPMRTTFLTAPLEFRRMSSAFGLRVHPILGTVRRHAGIDFAAPFGTPVRAVGDGAVIKAGYGGGFGKMVEIRHRDGMVTRYGHLRGFAPSLREGQVVTQGQVIGFVGSTGLSTGPHLHFETLVDGVSREPTRTLRAASGVTLSGPKLSAFASVRDGLASRLGLPATEAASRAADAAPPGVRIDVGVPAKSAGATR
ncbi:MAG: M23 family metallopeptidase [Gemmatimonadaceae bacterium]|nr:M23 family metallopeptidase [Gemmatimonadaceae bacterium]